MGNWIALLEITKFLMIQRMLNFVPMKKILLFFYLLGVFTLKAQEDTLDSYREEISHIQEDLLAQNLEETPTEFVVGKHKIKVELYHKNDGFYSDSIQIIQWGNFPKNIFLEFGDKIILDLPSSELDQEELPAYTILWINEDSVKLPFSNQIKLSHLPVKNSLSIKLFQYDSKGKAVNFGRSEKLSGKFNVLEYEPLFTNDAVVFGLLMLILAIIFYSSGLKSFQGFYKYVPALLLCYLVPAALNSLNIISKDVSGIYDVAKLYLLPASIVLLCMSIDLKAISRLGSKALIMFFTSTLGIIIGGPLALWLVGSWSPSIFDVPEGQELWRGFSTVAGSWIGGGANQTAMKEIAQANDTLFGQMAIVDVVIANIFMSVLLLGIGYRNQINKFFKADNTSIIELEKKMENFQSSIQKIPSFRDLIILLGVGFSIVGLAHIISDYISPLLTEWYEAKMKADPNSWIQYLSSITGGFFWLIILVTIGGVMLSFTKFKKYEGVGASKIGSIFLYVLVASIGMKMDIGEMIENWKEFKYIILVGAFWMLFHIIILFIVAKLIRAPFFFLAVGSQANVGGAASAPVVAGAFNPALAPVGVLLAVLGYVVGTVGALACMSMMAGIG